MKMLQCTLMYVINTVLMEKVVREGHLVIPYCALDTKDINILEMIYTLAVIRHDIDQLIAFLKGKLE